MRGFVFIYAIFLVISVNICRGLYVPKVDHFDELFCHSNSSHVCKREASINEVFNDFVASIFDRGVNMTSSADSMLSAFELFHTPEELKDPKLVPFINEVISFHHKVKNDFNHSSTQDFLPKGSNPFPYFAFLPVHVGTAKAGLTSQWPSRCFASNKVSATFLQENSKLRVHISISEPTHHACADYYVIYSIAHPELKSFFFHGDHTFDISLKDKSPAESWDVLQNGIRFLMFKDDPIQLLHDLVNTASLFLEPLTHKLVSESVVQHNLYFLEHYQGVKPFMKPRNSSPVHLPEDYIKSGDFVGVIRLDGLDPMLGWAMGSSTGHTVIALRDMKNDLFFCETTTKGKYWPHNGVQCTPYAEWVQYAVAADYNTVVLPLRSDLSDAFNVTAAWDFFNALNGTDYGYETLLFGWLDTARDNFPCLPPDYSSHCLEWEFIEMVFSFLEKKIPAVSRIFSQAWNKRVGTRNMKIPDVFMHAYHQGVKPIDISSIPEQDGWLYRTTRFDSTVDAPAQVCCVFVCNIWKAGGVFRDINDELNCSEQTNFDLYHLNIFDESRMGEFRPAVCQMQDPDNQLCQITGKYTLHLNQLNSEIPYKNMHESCPSEAPNYQRPPKC